MTSIKISSTNEITKYEFDSYMIYLKQIYDPEFLEEQDNNDIADLVNFEFDTLLSGEDINRFKEDYFIEEEDSKLIMKNMGY